MATVAGYKGKIGFRLRGSVAANSAWNYDAFESPTPDTLGAFDLLTATGDTLQERVDYNYDEVFTSRSGYADDGVTATNPHYSSGGSVQIEAGYNGLDQLFAAVLGYERVRDDTDLESPDYTSEAAGTVTASTASTLTDSGASFTSALVGSWVRLEKIGADSDIYYQVRLITDVPSSTQLTISPDWTDSPVATTPYTVARLFTHTFEPSQNMHMESWEDYGIVPWDTTRWASRTGTLVSHRINCGFEYQESAVNRLNLKLTPQYGLVITADFLPKMFMKRVVSRNSSSSSWELGSQSYTVKKRVQFADAVFRIRTFTTSGLTDSYEFGVNDFELSIDNGLMADIHSNSYSGEPLRVGYRKVTGSFVFPRSIATSGLMTDFANRSSKMADIVFSGPDGTSLSIFIRSLKLDNENVAMNSGGVVPERWSFTALQPSNSSITGMPAVSVGMEAGEIVVQTVSNNPFNYYMGQDNDAGV